MRKATNLVVDNTFLEKRARIAANLGYQKQKWVQFCEAMLAQGYTVTLYEARRTVSKYVTVSQGERKFTVRFSDHKPILHREQQGDCDFFVGRTNLRVTTTHDAIAATYRFFKEGKQA